MPALTQDQEVYIRRQVGSAPDDAGLQTIYDRLEPVHGDPAAVDFLVLEVLELRYAQLLATPAQFSVSGEYSQSTAENLRLLANLIGAWRAWMLSQGYTLGPGVVADTSAMTIAAPVLTNWR